MISPLEGEPVKLVNCTTALTQSGLYDIDYALNPYKGCTHGCLYCYAPDIVKCAGCGEWGSWVEARTNISRLLKQEIKKVGSGMIGLATVTDPYQPAEERLELTRACLEVISRSDASLMLMTKSLLARRDFDLLKKIDRLEFCVTIATFDESLAGLMEPKAPSPKVRLSLLKEAADCGLKTSAMISPWLIVTENPRGDLIEMIEVLGQIGCRNITIDRLRLRPTAVKRMRELVRHTGAVASERISAVITRSEGVDISQTLKSISAESRFPDVFFEIPRIE
jgi:DNA repair photolyase